MLDAKAALDQMVLISDSTDLYGPLADGLGKCACCPDLAKDVPHPHSNAHVCCTSFLIGMQVVVVTFTAARM